MAAYVNVDITFTGAGNEIVPVNRWSRCCYTLQVVSGSITLQGTIVQVNRVDPITGVAPTPVWNDLEDLGGTAMTSLGPGIYAVAPYALEAVNIIAAAAAQALFMQQGETD